MFLSLELGLIWLIYYGFGILTTYEMPLWASAILVILVDRTTSFVTDQIQHRRDARGL